MSILLVTVAVIASIAIPNRLESGNANDSSAIFALRRIYSAQERFQASGCVDGDGDGIGEFGYFGELSSGIGLRTKSGLVGSQRASPPVISGTFADVRTESGFAGGVVTRCGYVFQMYLPGRQGRGVPEADSGGVGSIPPNSNRSERLWCCYAWPTGGYGAMPVFFINQEGWVMAAPNDETDYLGDVRVPQFAAAFKRGSPQSLASPVADQDEAHDGQAWTRVH